MSLPVSVSSRKRRASAVVLVVDLVLLLFPPLQWAFAPGAASLWYYVIATVLVTASLFVLWALRDGVDDETEEIAR